MKLHEMFEPTKKAKASNPKKPKIKEDIFHNDKTEDTVKYPFEEYTPAVSDDDEQEDLSIENEVDEVDEGMDDIFHNSSSPFVTYKMIGQGINESRRHSSIRRRVKLDQVWR